MSGKTFYQRYWFGLSFIIFFAALGLAACGENVGSPTAASGGLRLNTLGPTNQAGSLPTSTPPGTGLAPTVVPFFTPVAPVTSGQYVLAFDYEAAEPILEASRVSRSAGPEDWQLEVSREGVIKLTINPRDKTRAQTQERFLSREKLDALLGELAKLAVLDWPNTTSPDKIKPDGLQRHLVLLLKGQPKKISDLSGNSGDGLDKILALLKETAEQAPLRNSP